MAKYTSGENIKWNIGEKVENKSVAMEYTTGSSKLNVVLRGYSFN